MQTAGFIKRIKEKMDCTDIVVLSMDGGAAPAGDNASAGSNVHYMPQAENVKYDSVDYIYVREQIRRLENKVMFIARACQRSFVNRLLWECENAAAVLYEDTDNPYEVEENVTRKDSLLWDVQANNMESQASMSGWLNSYNKQEFSREELHEYVENTYEKLKPYITDRSRILEVGIGSGMQAMRIAPVCRSYSGCDISGIVLAKLDRMCAEKGIENISLYQNAADEIDKIPGRFDIILMSSVTEYFSGYNYLRKVIEKCIDRIDSKGVVLFADIFDLAKKENYRSSVYRYAEMHRGCHYKKDFSHELFVQREYWKDIANQFPQIKRALISDKIGRCRNEINAFRYDVIFEIDHAAVKRQPMPLYKYQLTFNDAMCL